MKLSDTKRSLKTGLLLLLIFAFFIQPCQAALSKRPIFAYGGSLTEEEKEKTEKLLGVEVEDLKVKVNVDELNTLLHDDYPYTQCYSSVRITPAEEDEGIHVEITSPKTITKIKESDYANAAITAGITDIKITVGSVKAVDGSGALAGVYKALQCTSGELSKENIQVAQKELKTTSAINQKHEGADGYSDEVLNAAIAEIKAQMAREKEKGNPLYEDEISQIVDEAVNNYKLKKILDKKDVDDVNKVMRDFSRLELSDQQKKALKKFGKNLIKNGGKLMKDVHSAWDDLEPETKKEVGGFFKTLIQKLADFFINMFQDESYQS